jgi:hypothetical protein
MRGHPQELARRSGPIVDSLDEIDVFPAAVTVTRTSQDDFMSRQLVVSIDDEHVATLLWGDSVTRELEPVPHRLRVHNTLVWKTAEFCLGPGEQLYFEAVNRLGPGSLIMTVLFGLGPLYVRLNRM